MALQAGRFGRLLKNRGRIAPNSAGWRRDFAPATGENDLHHKHQRNIMRHAQNLIKSLQALAQADGNRTHAEARAASADVQAMVKSIGSSTGSITGDLGLAYRELLQLSRRRSLIAKIEAVAGFR